MSNLSYIFSIVVRLPISGGIGPVSRFTPKSRAFKFFNMPSSFGIVPMRLFPCNILHSTQFYNKSLTMHLIQKKIKISTWKTKEKHTILASKKVSPNPVQ